MADAGCWLLVGVEHRFKKHVITLLRVRAFMVKITSSFRSHAVSNQIDSIYIYFNIMQSHSNPKYVWVWIRLPENFLLC